MRSRLKKRVQDRVKSVNSVKSDNFSTVRIFINIGSESAVVEIVVTDNIGMSVKICVYGSKAVPLHG